MAQRHLCEVRLFAPTMPRVSPRVPLRTSGLSTGHRAPRVRAPSLASCMVLGV